MCRGWRFVGQVGGHGYRYDACAQRRERNAAGRTWLEQVQSDVVAPLCVRGSWRWLMHPAVAVSLSAAFGEAQVWACDGRKAERGGRGR